MTTASTRKKLIEVALPLQAINEASAREKSIRHGHPSTLHLWWARRPLAAARAVIFAQMVDDPSGYVDQLKGDPKLKRKAESILKARHKLWTEATATLEKAKKAGITAPEPGPEPKLDDILAEEERQRLFRIIEELVQWENTTNETVLQKAREEIWQSWRRTCAENAGHPRAKELFDRHKLPAFHDPFAGGGALPLEAQRLGLEAYASDLNPVAVLINKAMIEIPPKFAGRPPVNPESRKKYLGTPTPTSRRLHPGWRSRDYLPHFDQPGLVQFITFRLHDSVPASVVGAWKEELTIGETLLPADEPRMVELRRRVAHYEDAGHGDCHLRDPRIAELVEKALLHFDGERYRLMAWCIMPNHVHVLLEVLESFPLADVLHSWKSFTAKEANKLLGRTGEFWMREYHDRFIRDENHFAKAKTYIEENPLKAGLVKEAADWKWSSAGKEAGGTPALPGMWRGAQGLAEDVRYYGQWMRDEAEKRIGHLYPKVKAIREKDGRYRHATPEEILNPKSEILNLTVIAWLWARTVKSPNPAFREVDVPLASTFMLSTKPGKEAWVEPVIEDGGYRFTVQVGKPKDANGTAFAAAKAGTKLARGANFRCVMSGTPIAGDYIKAEGKAGRMGARLMAIVAEGERGRVYLPPTPEHEAVAKKAKPEWKPEVTISGSTQYLGVQPYGMTRLDQLYSSRQLALMTALSQLASEVRETIASDAANAKMDKSSARLNSGGIGTQAYADALITFLAMTVSKLTSYHCTLGIWRAPEGKTGRAFGRQAIPMVWDYPECNPFAGAGGDWEGACSDGAKVLATLGSGSRGSASQVAAQKSLGTDGLAPIVSTDPPYYDNVPYADLSDFFYVWLRQTLKEVFPDLFATVAVPKSDELVAFAYRHESKAAAGAFFMDGMIKAMHHLVEGGHPSFPVTIYYAFRQAESDDDEGTASTGWETFLEAVVQAGFSVSGTWPMRTELSGALKTVRNALASSIVLVCRPRAADAPTATRREFVAALQGPNAEERIRLERERNEPNLSAKRREEIRQRLEDNLPAALKKMQAGNIAPVDLAQAAIGPGMAVFTRYARVLDAQGNALTVREALALINETLDTALAEQEGDFDADSRWALAWFEQHGFAEGEYGVALVLATAKNTSIDGMRDAGILFAKAGKVRLLAPEELPGSAGSAGVPPASFRPSAWRFTHELIRALSEGGEEAAAALLTGAGGTPALPGETARELAYRLYTVCERKKRAAEALRYNALVQSWPEIVRLAADQAQPLVQAELSV